MSISTTSGCCARTTSSACAPSAASPATLRSGSASISARRPPRTSAWSSARTTRMLMARAPASDAHTRKPPSGPAPVSSRPPTAAARSRMPAIPLPSTAPLPSRAPRRRRAPRPRRRPATAAIRTCARLPAPACRATFVSASRTIRYAAAEVASGTASMPSRLELDLDPGLAQRGDERGHVADPGGLRRRWRRAVGAAQQPELGAQVVERLAGDRADGGDRLARLLRAASRAGAPRRRPAG